MNLQKILAAPRSRYFWMEREKNKWSSGLPESYFNAGADPMGATFDIGNNKTLLSLTPTGEIRSLTFFEESEYVDNIPGVWVHKRSKIYRDLSFSVCYDDNKWRLSDWDGTLSIGLLENVIPICEYELPDLSVSVLHFAPISECGVCRPRALYSIVHVTNKSDVYKEVQVELPEMCHYSFVMKKDSLPPDIRFESGRVVEPLALPPGAAGYYATITTVYAENEQKELAYGALYWLNETLKYNRKLTGAIEVKGDGFLGEFIQRTIHQCQQCIGMDASGTIAGSSWGTFPTMSQIWMKDMYYSLLPLAQMEPGLFAKSMEWFAWWGVRPESRQFAGGVKHSLSNSLSGVLMAGQYYQATGDLDYFSDKPCLVQRLIDIIEEMLSSRSDPDIWLFPSLWISDGLSLGDYHTGSNITVYAALRGLALILEEMGQSNRASDYIAISEKVKAELLNRCITAEGPYGPQFLEGIGEGDPALREEFTSDSYEEHVEKCGGFGVQFYEFFNNRGDGPYLVHDGEETDTTLAPFYGLMSYSDPIYKNYTRFAMSEHNRFYRPVSKAILWENCTDSTFPSYVTGAANVVDEETYHQYFDPIRKLTDLDGSIWWWPYPYEAKDNSVMVRTPGKCGWAAGALIALMLHDWFGVKYDAPTRSLKIEPLDFLKFKWDYLPLGSLCVSIDTCGNTITNHSNFSITLEAWGRKMHVLPGERVKK